MQELVEIHAKELVEPNGWIRIPLYTIENGEVLCAKNFGQLADRATLNLQHRPLRTFFIQIAVLAMHQNGRDTHIRQVKIYSPRKSNIFGQRIIEPSTAQVSAHFMVR